LYKQDAISISLDLKTCLLQWKYIDHFVKNKKNLEIAEKILPTFVSLELLSNDVLYQLSPTLGLPACRPIPIDMKKICNDYSLLIEHISVHFITRLSCWVKYGFT